MTERLRISSGSPYEASMGFSRAILVGNRVLVSGTAPIWPNGSCDPQAGRQAERCLEIILDALRAAGAGAGDIVRTRVFLVDAADAEEVGSVLGRLLNDVRPASTMVVVAGLLDPRWKVEIEAEAVISKP
jgi:enamine deaminase RidA (YjgF/YER057c/UK114 family)